MNGSANMTMASEQESQAEARGSVKIRVKYHSNIEPLEKIKQGDWIDLRCAENIFMKQGEYRQISLGVSIELPKGYFALVLPRSSTFKRFGILLVNSMGVVDESYCGDNDVWNFLAYATRTTFIPRNERIAQFMIVKKQPELDFETVDTLGNPSRGGIGSTGGA